MSDLVKWISGIIGGLTLGGLVLWGVPTYLKSTVHDLYVAEGEAAGAPAGVTQNEATIHAVQAQLTGIENRMIARDKLFMEYLERQAE